MRVSARSWVRGAFLILLSLPAFSGCSRKTDFLYYRPVPPLPGRFSVTHKVKELEGETNVDILWIIDNSPTMGSDQQNVADNTQTFMKNFTKLGFFRWKMGLLSTDIKDDPYIGFTPASLLSYRTKNPVGLFQDAVGKLGTSGDGMEKYFQPLYDKIRAYPNFLRKNAMLAIILVTDTDDQSALSPQELLEFLKKMKGSLKRVMTYGVLGPQDWGCPLHPGEDAFIYATSRARELIDGTHGKTYPLCSSDFGANLSAISKDLVKRAQNPQLPLKKRPIASTIRVYHKGEAIPGGPPEEGGYWMYDFDLNAIVFSNLDFAPGDDEEVTVQYEEDTGRSSGTR